MASWLLAHLLPIALVLGGQTLVGESSDPTPPVEPASLEEAVGAYHDGNHAQSTALLRRLTAEKLTPGEATAVKHLLGLNLVEMGHFDEAIDTLTSALKDARRPGRTKLTDQLRWWLAKAYEGKGEHLLAGRSYGAISRARHSSLSAEAMFRRAAALSKAGRVGSERRVLEGFIETYPDSPHIWDAQARLGEIKSLVRDHDEAVSLFRRVLRYARRGDAARIARRGLTALIDANVRAALALDNWPNRLDDLHWLVDERRFEEAIPRLEAYQRGAMASRQHGRALRSKELLARSLRETGHTEDALKMYDELAELGRFPTSTSNIIHMHAVRGDHKQAEQILLNDHARRKTRAYWQDLGRLRMKFGRYKEAEKALLRAVAGRSRRHTESLWQDITWCAVRTGQTERAMKLLTQIATRKPRRRVWATYWQARTLQDAGQLKEASEHFRRLEANDPFSYYGLMAWSRLQDIAAAAVAADHSPDGHQVTEDGPTAQTDNPVEPSAPAPVPDPFQRVPEAPRTYPPLSPPVAVLSAPVSVAGTREVLLASVDGPMPEIGPTLEEAGLHPEVRGTLGWPVNMRQLRPDMAFLPAPRAERLKALEALAGPWGKIAPEAQRALEFERLGFTELATGELRVIEADIRTLRRHGWKSLTGRGRADLLDNRRQKKQRSGARIGHLGRRTRAQARAFKNAYSNRAFQRTLRDARIALGDPHASRKRALERGNLSGAAEKIDLERWRSAYPLAWSAHIAAACKLFDVPPAFMYGIMTVESAFHAHAVSISHAYGSLQMIPRTGRRVSSELELPSFTPERLLEPAYGIPMGTQYMGRLLDRFHHQEPLAAAAYNAGPHRVAAWLKANPNRPLDVFIEEIPFRQARGYSKSVLKHTARLRHIYYGEQRMYVPNTLIAEHTKYPNY